GRRRHALVRPRANGQAARACNAVQLGSGEEYPSVPRVAPDTERANHSNEQHLSAESGILIQWEILNEDENKQMRFAHIRVIRDPTTLRACVAWRVQGFGTQIARMWANRIQLLTVSHFF